MADTRALPAHLAPATHPRTPVARTRAGVRRG